jgi:hypothetical protein
MLPTPRKSGWTAGISVVLGVAFLPLAFALTPVIVAVIDTGMDLLHSAFTGKLWVNPGEIAGDGIDNDVNGYVDDVNGYDFLNHDSDPTGGPDGDAHGTMVSGRVLQGARALADQVRIMSLKAGSGSGLPLSAIVEALDYAWRNGARIVNMSFGTTFDFASLRQAIAVAAQRGLHLIAAAGNSGTTQKNYPAAYDGVWAVAASDASGRKTSWSSYGSWVDWTAPGDKVTTTTFGGGNAVVSGTSFSSPFIAGVVAQYLAHHPEMTPDQVGNHLATLDKDVNRLNSKKLRGKLGRGFVDEVVADRVTAALPLPTSSALNSAKAQVVWLQKELSAADAKHQAAREAERLARAEEAKAAGEVRDARVAYHRARAQYEEAAGSDPLVESSLSQQMEQAWERYVRVLAKLRELEAQSRAARVLVREADSNRDELNKQLRSAQKRVEDLERQLEALGAPAVDGLAAQQAEVHDLVRRIQAVHAALHSPLPEGLEAGEFLEAALPGSVGWRD